MLTQSELKSRLHYNKNTGIFTWIKCNRKSKEGCIAGNIATSGYVLIEIDKKRYQAHKLAFLYMQGKMPTQSVDHINHIRKDNQFENLRIVSHQENCKNRGVQKNNKSGVTGVCWNKNRGNWLAGIIINGTTKYLGSFTSLEKASLARKNAEKLYGFHKNHGKDI